MKAPCETERIAMGVIEKTLPKVDWTHHAHLRAGLWHVLHYDERVAMDLMRVRIRAYNEATGVENTETSGYHATITQFYLLMIRHILKGCHIDVATDELAELVIRQLGERELPFQYYTRATLFSPEARAHWLAPDLKALPCATMSANKINGNRGN